MGRKEAKKEARLLQGKNEVPGLASTSLRFKVVLQQVAVGAPIGAARGETTSTRLHLRWLRICAVLG